MKLVDDRARGFVFLLFWYIHETDRLFEENEFLERIRANIFVDTDSECDVWNLFDTNPRYSSEALGFDFEKRIHDCYELYRQPLQVSKANKYLHKAFANLKKDFMDFFGYILPFL